MKRYTQRDENGIAYINNFYKHTHGLQASENLAKYEELNATPEECAAALELMRKKEAGLVVELPVPIGSIVYCIWEKENKCLYFQNGCEENCEDCNSYKREYEIKEEKFRLRDVEYFNKFIFPTPEAAQSALEQKGE